MPASRTSKLKVKRVRHGRSVTVPFTNTKLNLPDGAGLAWYAGIGTMAAAELVEWPVALLLAGTHFIENNARNRDIDELADGISAGV